MNNEHRCSECGFLGLLNKTTMQTEEAHHKYRDSGSTQNEQGKEAIHLNLPVCVRGKRDFSKEFSEGADTEVVTACISTPYPCDSFLQWVVGFSPREHFEMLEVLKLRDQQERDREDSRTRDNRNFLISFISAAAAVASAIISLVAIYVSVAALQVMR